MSAFLKVLHVMTFVNIFNTGYAVHCRSGWVRFQDSCYLFSHDVEPWHTAQLNCQLHRSTLAEITTDVENSFIANEAKTRGHYFWIGGNDIEVEGVWLWIGSDTKLTYTNWHPNEPNNSGADEHCLLVYPDKGWNDYDCLHALNYICEMNDETVEVIG